MLKYTISVLHDDYCEEGYVMEHDIGFLTGILEHLNVGVFVLDAEGRYIYVNQTYCGFFDRTPDYFEEASIQTMKDLNYLSSSVWEQVLERKAPVTALMTITHDDANRVYHHFTSAVPIFHQDGSIKSIVYLIDPMENIAMRIQDGILNKQYMRGTDAFSPAAAEGVIAESPEMKKLLALLATVSKSDASILITGPTGSGKQVLAEYAHRTSARVSGPFVGIDCAAIPENLLESELFGYEKGAFTGASARGKAGQIEMADGGTLFLDEINSMPLGLQGKLLHVLETKKIRRIGTNEERPIDFRLICASNEKLEELIQNGSFRSDLYYRISVVPIHVPPLRERKEDIVALTLQFLQLFCNKYSCIKVLSEEMLNAIKAYDWPGNVRELRNFIERIVVTSPDTDVMVDTLPDWLRQSVFHHAPETGLSEYGLLPASYGAEFSFRSYMEQCEKRLLQESLARLQTPAKVAAELKLDLSNVYRKLRKHGL